MLLAVLQGMAQPLEEHLRLQFCFESVSGKTVTDSVSGIKATLMSQASVVSFGQHHAMDLGSQGGYLSMTRNAGAVVRDLTDLTVSVCYRLEPGATLTGNGYFLWCFSQSSANSETASPYLGYRLNAQRLAISTGGWANETGMQVGTPSVSGRWVHALYRQKGQTAELFLDGKLAAKATGLVTPATAFTAVPTYNWIGRCPFSGDTNLKNTLVTAFRVYDCCLDDEAVQTLAAEGRQLDYDYNYATPGDLTLLQETVSTCRQWLDGATTGYAPNAVAELRDGVLLAEMELRKGKASDALIAEYISSLTSLLSQAKATAGYEARNVFPHSDDHGFVHPGGIVSQADIDRARQLLAEGDEKVKAAWERLCANEYAQAGVATWPTETVIRGGSSGQNYMNCARGAAMAYQNALRWKIGGTRENAEAAVRIMMQWARACKGLGGDTNISLAAGIYGYEWANAAELMRDYEGWSRADFEEFKQWMIRVFYNPAIDFLRRRHDTWLNWRYAHLGERPGHYWSNWGLCNALCVMSLGILCDDVHMYNQGVSFYKYDHVGTFRDRSSASVILNDGCNEFIGNLVPVVLPDARGPLGYLGQMQESGRDQGHSLMALGLALDICTVGLNQGDDLFAYMDDRIAAGTEFVAAMNFGGVAASSLPWKDYNYADCRGTMGAAWQMTGPNTGGAGELRPFWERVLGYYEGLRGIKLPYSEKASAAVGIDGGGGNYSQNSGGFDHLGFSTLTSYRPAIGEAEGITPLSGDIIYQGQTLRNQTNLGGLKYKYEAGSTLAIPADGADITLVPQLPEGAEDSGLWTWNTGQTTRQITVKADRSYLYRVTYTAPNGTQSHQSFAIAVSGDADPDAFTAEMTLDGETTQQQEVTVLCGSTARLRVTPATGWTGDFLWDNGVREAEVGVPSLVTSRTYTCQYANQSGAVSEGRFTFHVVPALQTIDGTVTDEAYVLEGTSLTLALTLPAAADPGEVVWSDGTRGASCVIESIESDLTVTAGYDGHTYTYTLRVKPTSGYSYYQLLTPERGYRRMTSAEELQLCAPDHYFVLASEDADLLLRLDDAPLNGNKALVLTAPADPARDAAKVFTLEYADQAFHLRNLDYDGLLLQTEWNRPDQLRTHDQPLPCEWSRLLFSYTEGAWTVENGKYPGHWLGLWQTAQGYREGEELACDRTGDDVAHLQIFAIERTRYHADFLTPQDDAAESITATSLLVNPQFTGNGYGWTMSGTWGNQRFNGAVEVWHSSRFDFSQQLTGLPAGRYTVSCQMSGYGSSCQGMLYARSALQTVQATATADNTGSSFDAERDRMAANEAYGRISVELEVTDGTLTLGITDPTEGTNWLVWDNFTLTYSGSSSVGITLLEEGASEDNSCYDLQGRRVLSPSRGLYICGGRKFIVR